MTTQPIQTNGLVVLTGMAQPYERARLSSVLSSLRAATSHGVLATLVRRIVAAGTRAQPTSSTMATDGTFGPIGRAKRCAQHWAPAGVDRSVPANATPFTTVR